MTVLVWIIVFFCVWRGVNSSSHMVWVSVPTPILFIIVMIFKGLTLPGRDIGLKMYLLGYDAQGKPPNWVEELSDVSMWADAMAQVFYCTGICGGTIMAYASFNPKDKPALRDTITCLAATSGTAFIAGFAVFSAVGFLIHIGSPVSDRVQSIGLAYVAYPAAVE